MRRDVKGVVKFTVNSSMCKVPVEGNQCKDNVDAMISDFALTGKGLVKGVEVLKQDLSG